MMCLLNITAGGVHPSRGMTRKSKDSPWYVVAAPHHHKGCTTLYNECEDQR